MKFIKKNKLQELRKKNFTKDNLELSKKLGAEIVILHGDNIVEQILRYSKIRNVTKIIIGRNYDNHKSLSKIFKKNSK